MADSPQPAIWIDFELDWMVVVGFVYGLVQTLAQLLMQTMICPAALAHRLTPSRCLSLPYRKANVVEAVVAGRWNEWIAREWRVDGDPDLTRRTKLVE